MVRLLLSRVSPAAQRAGPIQLMEDAMKRYRVWLLALVFVLVGAPGFAAAPAPAPASPGQPGFGGPRMGQNAHYRFASLLGLSQEQKEKMREIRNRFLTDTHDLRYDLIQKRLEMRKLFTDPKVNAATLLAKEKESAALRQKLQDRRAQMKIEWRSVLTPDQIQKLDQMPMGRRMDRGARWGMM